MHVKSDFIEACYQRPTSRTPVWLMRQAGRYQPSYRALRQQHSFLELCRNPELAARVTVQAVEELDVDAAIIFSDILLLLEAMGSPVELTEQGPVLHAPVRDAPAVEALSVPDPRQRLSFVYQAITLARRSLPDHIPLLGFAGAPITLASYLVEGGNSKSYHQLKALLFGHPDLAHRLLAKLAQSITAHLRAQIEAGCQAVQLFDSWGGVLGPQDYRAYALPYLQQIISALKPLGAPCILFATCSATLLEVMKESGAEVIGLDWRVDLGEARRRLGPTVAIQGNLDPGCLFLDKEALTRRVQQILDQAAGHPGFVFNLGHGVLPNTRPEQARFLVDTVHRLSSTP